MTLLSPAFIIIIIIILATLQGLWDLSSTTRDQTLPWAVRARSPNQWTTREFPDFIICEMGISGNAEKIPHANIGEVFRMMPGT